jgi:hypothetical protein
MAESARARNDAFHAGSAERSQLPGPLSHGCRPPGLFRHARPTGHLVNIPGFVNAVHANGRSYKKRFIFNALIKITRAGLSFVNNFVFFLASGSADPA